MQQKKRTTEEILRILRDADSGKDLEAILRQHNVSAGELPPLEEEVGRHGARRRS